MPYRVLVVDPDQESKATVERVLTGAGNFVTRVPAFSQAKDRLQFAPPDLLVTALKLGAYNGIQLVLRAHAKDRRMPAIVLHDAFDPVLEKDAIEAGASYVTTPVDEPSLRTLVARLLGDAHVPDAAATFTRKWPRKQASVPANVSGGEAKVVDVSYSGLRLEMSGMPVDEPLRAVSVRIPDVGTVPVYPVWARAGSNASRRWWCGAEVDPADEQATHVWRQFVDSLS